MNFAAGNHKSRHSCYTISLKSYRKCKEDIYACMLGECNRAPIAGQQYESMNVSTDNS